MAQVVRAGGLGLIKRTIEISRQAAHLSVRHEQLVVQPTGETKAAATTIPCEDIGVLLVDHPATTYSHQALAALMRSGSALVVCGNDHLPAGLLLPMSSHHEVLWRIQEQVEASAPAKKRIWRQLVVAKVRRQARNLPTGSPARRLLETLATEVKSGDTTNVEGQAAKVYWSAWLDPSGGSGLVSSATAAVGDVSLNSKAWQRNQNGLDPLNVMLNYGYTVFRAAIARALVSAGLFPALAVHHQNRRNGFALADDLVEPFRPLVDAKVREIYRQGRGIQEGLDQGVKASLLSLLTHAVRIGETTGPLMVSLHRMTASYLRCLRGDGKRLALPDWEPQEPRACT